MENRKQRLNIVVSLIVFAVVLAFVCVIGIVVSDRQ